MADTLKLEIVTAEGPIFSEDVELVTIPGVAGEFGVYAQHVPLMTQIVPGEIIVRKGGHDTFFVCGSGLIEVTANRVAILTDMAVQTDKIDEAAAEEAVKRAEARLQEKLSDEEVATINASLARSLAQLKVKRWRK
ncbi:MAG TPA: ATP synthase F1 subunit epsilon [Verrucomicrobiae bacterium]|nr:ATP synthase F1 subunit epsilon [Verrucomicrobiae bacterium]